MTLLQVQSLYSKTISVISEGIYGFLEDHYRTCPLKNHHHMSVAESCPTFSHARQQLHSIIPARATMDLLEKFQKVKNEDCLGYYGLIRDKNVRSTSLPLLLTKDITKIWTEKPPGNLAWDETEGPIWELLESDAILELVTNYGGNMTELRIEEKPCEDLNTFRTALNQMPKLQVLCFNVGVAMAATDDYLEAVGKTCPHLRVLSIKGNVTSKGMKKFCYADYPTNKNCNQCCGVLEQFLMPKSYLPKDIADKSGQFYYEVPVIVYSILLHCFPKLTVFPENEIGLKKASKAIVSLAQKQISFSYNISVIDSIRTSENINVFSEHCPNVKNITIYFPKRNVISRLHLFENLTNIHFHNCVIDSRILELESWLENHGHKIQSLMFKNSSFRWNPRELDLCKVAKYCRNLEQLECNSIKCSYKESTSFPKLRKLIIMDRDFRPLGPADNVQSSEFRDILFNLPVAEDVYIDTRYSFTSQDIVQITKGHTYSSFKRLYLGRARNLTLGALRLLINHCPQLKLLGNLAIEMSHHFEGTKITYDQLESFRRQLKRENIDVTIVASQGCW